jgi:hypothetical protein
MLAPNLLSRCRPTGEQVSGMSYLHSYPWDKPAEPTGQTDTSPSQNLNNKQKTEKEQAAEGEGCPECTREGGKGKELISMQTFSK